MTALHHPGLSALLLQVHQFQEAVISCSWCAALADALQLVSVAKPSLKPSLFPSYAWESSGMNYSNLQLSKIYLKLLSSVCHSTFFTIPKIIVSCRVSAAPSRHGAYAQGQAFRHLEYMFPACVSAAAAGGSSRGTNFPQALLVGFPTCLLHLRLCRNKQPAREANVRHG